MYIKNWTTKIFLYTSTLTLAFVISACGGGGGSSGSDFEPGDDGTPTVPFTFTIEGQPLGGGGNWQCSGNISISPGNINKALYGTATVKLAEGDYNATVDVNCACNAILQNCLNFWTPSLKVTSGAFVVTRPPQAVNGFHTTVALSVSKDGNAGLNSQPSSYSLASTSISKENLSAEISTTTLSSAAIGDKSWIEIAVLEDFNKTASGAAMEGVNCTIDYDQAWYGGFGFHQVRVKNTSTNTLSNWGVNLWFSEGKPSADWFWGADSIVNNGDHALLVMGNQSLAPNAEVVFGVGGTYSGGPNNITVECY